MDEVFLVGENYYVLYENGEVYLYILCLEDVGLISYFFEVIIGGEVKENVVILCSVFDGELGVYLDIVFLNVGFGLFVNGKVIMV